MTQKVSTIQDVALLIGGIPWQTLHTHTSQSIGDHTQSVLCKYTPFLQNGLQLYDKW